MDHLRKQLAELAIRVLALPDDSLHRDPETLVRVEELARQVLKEVAAVRAARQCLPGERRGCWRIAGR
jgi:hypothetical protein